MIDQTWFAKRFGGGLRALGVIVCLATVWAGASDPALAEVYPVDFDGLGACFGSPATTCDIDSGCLIYPCSASLKCVGGPNNTKSCRTKRDCDLPTTCESFRCNGGSRATYTCVNDAGCPGGSCVGSCRGGARNNLSCRPDHDCSGGICDRAESLVQVQFVAHPGGTPNVVCVAVINRDPGQAYTFDWPHAGPGGFRGSTGAGSVGGVGAMWRWDTLGEVISPTNVDPCVPAHCTDADNLGTPCTCLSVARGGEPPRRRVFDLDGRTTRFCNGGPNNGRKCAQSADCPQGTCGESIHISSGSVVSSLQQFFSPPTEVLRLESRAQPVVGGFLARTTVVNKSPNVIGLDLAAGAAFAELTCGTDQIECGDVCCDGEDCDLLCDAPGIDGGLRCGAPAVCNPPGRFCGTHCVNTSYSERHCGGCSGCAGGANDGQACSGPTDCPGGTCDDFGCPGSVCAGGANAGLVCTTESDCGGPPNSCVAACCAQGRCEPCEFPGSQEILVSGEEAALCTGSRHPLRQVSSKISAFCDPSDAPCVLDEEGRQGTIHLLVPDLTVSIPDDAPFLTLASVKLFDDVPGNGNGRAEPGETIRLFIALENAGPVGVPAGSPALLSARSACIGGVRHGLDCDSTAAAPLLECPSWCERVCSSGTPCMADTDCDVGTCGSLACTSGPNRGDACAADADCPGGGNCPVAIGSAEATYLAGIPAGPAPTSSPPTSDCNPDPSQIVTLPRGVNGTGAFTVAIPPAHGVETTRLFELSFQKCRNGGRHGLVCGADADCPGGSCGGVCSGPPNAGLPCAQDAECGASPAACIAPVVKIPLAISSPVGTAKTQGGPPVVDPCAALFNPPADVLVDPLLVRWSPFGICRSTTQNAGKSCDSDGDCCTSGTCPAGSCDSNFRLVGGDLGELRRAGSWGTADVTCLGTSGAPSFAEVSQVNRRCRDGGNLCNGEIDCPGVPCVNGHCPDNSVCTAGSTCRNACRGVCRSGNNEGLPCLSDPDCGPRDPDCAPGDPYCTRDRCSGRPICSGGTNDGADCDPDAACAGGRCELSCEGGLNHGSSCATVRDCGGGACVHRCLGGTDRGQSCNPAAACGTIEGACRTTCGGGTRDTLFCDPVDNDPACPGGGNCLRRCHGGGRHDAACLDDADCPGACLDFSGDPPPGSGTWFLVREPTLDTSLAPLDFCWDDEQLEDGDACCPIGNGGCFPVTLQYCNAGANVGLACTVDDCPDGTCNSRCSISLANCNQVGCPAGAGVCTPYQCAGGVQNGLACSVDHCPAGRCIPACIGEPSEGALCRTDAECGGGTCGPNVCGTAGCRGPQDCPAGTCGSGGCGPGGFCVAAQCPHATPCTGPGQCPTCHFPRCPLVGDDDCPGLCPPRHPYKYCQRDPIKLQCP